MLNALFYLDLNPRFRIERTVFAFFIDNPKPFKKGMAKVPGSGLKKSLYTLSKDLGYSKSDISNVFLDLSLRKVPELEKIRDSPDTEALMRTVASHIINGLKNGDFRIEKILDHAIGKPQQSITHEGIEEPVKQVIIMNGQKLQW